MSARSGFVHGNESSDGCPLGDPIAEEHMSDVNVVFGASGGIGNAIVRELARQGASVRGVNRSGSALVPDGVETVAADATKIDDVRAAMRDAAVV